MNYLADFGEISTTNLKFAKSSRIDVNKTSKGALDL